MPCTRTIGTLWILAALAPLARSSEAVVLPPENAELNRLHVGFRWEQFPDGPGDQLFELVEDDGSANPFRGATPLASVLVDRAEPRLVLRHGLAFGKAYAWRTSALVAGLPQGLAPQLRPFRRSTPVHRFRTAPVHPLVPDAELIVPPGAAPPEPGIVIFAMRRTFLTDATNLIVGYDEDGELVLQMAFPLDVDVGDMRLLDDGRILFQKTGETMTYPDGSVRPTCRITSVVTLEGATTWESPHTKCGIPTPPFQIEGAHHEVFPMPNGNFLALEYDNRVIPYPGVPNGFWQGDAVVEYDRHTKQVVKSWSTFDAICLDDHLPPNHPTNPGPGGDWNHCNAVIYDQAQDAVFVSARHQSRIIKVDWSTQQTVWQLGEDSFPCGDVPQGFGDNLFSFQHAPEVQPNGNLLIFNNGNYIEPLALPRHTTLVELAIDTSVSPPTATRIWEAGLVLEDLVTPAYADFVGDADRQPGGHTLACDGRHGNILEFDENGDVVWFLDAGPGVPGSAANPGIFIFRAEKVPSILIDTPGDTDGDWDLDLEDLGRMQVAATGPGPAGLRFPATLSDQDGDDDVDGDDLAAFAFWMSGRGR